MTPPPWVLFFTMQSEGWKMVKMVKMTTWDPSAKMEARSQQGDDVAMPHGKAI